LPGFDSRPASVSGGIFFDAPRSLLGYSTPWSPPISGSPPLELFVDLPHWSNRGLFADPLELEYFFRFSLRHPFSLLLLLSRA